MNTIMWADVETGGLDPKAHDITQIGIIFEIDGEVAQELNLLVRPDPARLTQQALDVQGRTIEQVMRHPLSRQAAARILLDNINRYEQIVAFGGQNPKFDHGFLATLYDEFPILNPEFIDLREQARRFAELPNYRQGTICDHLGIKFKAHDALEDVRACRLAYRMLEAGVML